MKALLKIFFFMAVISLVSGCDKTDALEFDDASSSKNDAAKSITMGFNLVFTGTYDFTGPDPVCGDFPPFIRVINTGEGTGTHFGKVNSYFDFCVDVRDSSYPNGHIVAYFEDKNGDQLFVKVAGFVIGGRVPGMPSFANSYFKDPFEIIGGTGRFEGATGNGMTNDYNSSKDPFSHHHWKGKITMLKSNNN
jgi:hypothetical protein